MKKIYVIRHGPLKGKYADYNKLNYHNFVDLLLKKVEPLIDKEKTLNLIKNIHFNPPFKIIFCSTQNRGIQTAEIAKKMTRSEIVPTPLLNEVDFFDGILKEEETNSMEEIRKAILTKWYNNQCAETFVESCKKWEAILEMTKQSPEQEILLVTHGWFMRIIQIYLQKKSFKNISLSELLAVKPAENMGLVTLYL